MWLRSSAFTDGSVVPRRFTCDGEDISPPLEWGDAPSGTRSFALLCDDPDAPSGTWHHWAVYDIPADRTGFNENMRPGAANAKQGTNDNRVVGYSGPCPPRGHGRHRYRFHLLALSAERLPLNHPSCQAVEREARNHVMTETVLTGILERR